jgi:hypothetical protein
VKSHLHASPRITIDWKQRKKSCRSTNTNAPLATSTPKRSRSSLTPRSPSAHTAAAISSAFSLPLPSPSKAVAGTPTATVTPNPNPPAMPVNLPTTRSPQLIQNRAIRKRAATALHHRRPQLRRPLLLQHPPHRPTKSSRSPKATSSDRALSQKQGSASSQSNLQLCSD